MRSSGEKLIVAKHRWLYLNLNIYNDIDHFLFIDIANNIIYCHPQTDISLYHNSSVWLDSWNASTQLTLRLISYPWAIVILSVSEGFFSVYRFFLHLLYQLPDFSIHEKSFAY